MLFDATTSCPVCGGVESRELYWVNQVPVNSVRLMRSSSESINIQTGAIHLRQCRRCDMVWNSAFDPSLVRYDSDYEETQGYSPTFQRFHEWLAAYLVNHSSLEGKTVIEIGCGKGEFLALLAEHGIEAGIGFDPSFQANRQAYPDCLTFFPTRFPPSSGPTPTADFYLSKMTLEHIHNPGDFIGKLKEQMPEHAQIAVQVPAFERIANELAYWDIYYEHCNYFCRHSLVTLFENNGFEVIDVSRVFDEQYLNLVARVGTRTTTIPRDADLGLAEFAQDMRVHLQQWRDALIPAAQQQALLIWGAASKAVALLHALPELQAGTTLVDINPNKHGTYLPATQLEINAPNELSNRQFDTILIANPIYQQEIEDHLSQLNIQGNSVLLNGDPPMAESL